MKKLVTGALTSLAWAVVVALVAPFILGPPLIRYGLEMAAPEVKLLTPAEIPEDRRRLIGQLGAEFHHLGFQSLQWLKIGGLGQGGGGYGLVVGDFHASDLALIYFKPPPRTTPEAHQAFYVALDRRFGDGARAITNNRDQPITFRFPENYHSATVPGTLDVERIVRFHRDWAAGLGLGAPVALPAADSLRARIVDDARWELDQQVGFGYMHRDDDGVYRPTWKGALVMTWTHAWDFTKRGLLGLRRALLPADLDRMRPSTPRVER